MGVWIFWSAVVVALLFWRFGLPWVRSSWRRNLLIKKYGPEAGQRLASGTVWEGMTEEMAVSLLGQPDEKNIAVDQGKETMRWRYFAKDRRVAKLRLTFVNGLVTGWAYKE